MDEKSERAAEAMAKNTSYDFPKFGGSYLSAWDENSTAKKGKKEKIKRSATSVSADKFPTTRVGEGGRGCVSGRIAEAGVMKQDAGESITR
jgi:hypothetical protein